MKLKWKQSQIWTLGRAFASYLFQLLLLCPHPNKWWLLQQASVTCGKTVTISTQKTDIWPNNGETLDLSIPKNVHLKKKKFIWIEDNRQYDMLDCQRKMFTVFRKILGHMLWSFHLTKGCYLIVLRASLWWAICYQRNRYYLTFTENKAIKKFPNVMKA